MKNTVLKYPYDTNVKNNKYFHNSFSNNMFNDLKFLIV